MTESVSLLENLKRRRVPQIAGAYVAAMWLVIELGDWVSERFSLSPNLTSFVFVAMLVLLPSVLLVAWNHGTPGRDRWTVTEKVFLPVNAVIAAAVLWFVSPQIDVEAATETVTIEDESGAIQRFEVAREGFHREVISFFWSNDTGDASLDWLAYGLPIMFTHDINRVSPVITATTPFDSERTKVRLREQGFDSLLGVPRGLAVELARERRSSALIDGSFSTDGDSKVVSIKLIDAESGEVLDRHTGRATDWMTAIDSVTAAVLGTWEITPAGNQSDDALSEHFTASMDAVREYVNAQVAIELDGDYESGIAALDAALAIDGGFAEARSELSVRQYLSGNLVDARESASLALRNSYRLSTNSEFILKANRYFFDGDYERGERVLDIWLEVQPNNTRALRNVAQLARLRGTPESLDKAVGAYERLLELRPEDYNVYRQIAEVEEQRGNYDVAIELLNRFLGHAPESGAAHNQLARLYQASGDLDAAKSALEDAAILSKDPVEAELGLVRLEVRRGQFEAAEARLDTLRSDELSPQQDLQVLLVAAEVATVLGRIERAMALYTEANQAAESVLPPAVRIITIEGQRSALLQFLGRYDEALDALAAVQAQLQPPLSYQLNFIFTAVHEAAGNREAFRQVAADSREVSGQLAQFYQPLIMLEQARIDIWDGNDESAVARVDTARTMLSQSFVSVFLNNLSVSDMFVAVADLYRDAGAPDKAKRELEAVLRIFPSSALAKLSLAQVLVEEGDEENARALLVEALDVWETADEAFVLREKASELMARIDGSDKTV